MIGWRKDRKNEGKWILFGPASELRAGEATVTKKSGETTRVRCTGVSRSFDVEGVPHVYGHVAARQEKREPTAREESDGLPVDETGDVPF